MRALAAIVRTRFLLLLHYRAAALAGVVTQVFFGLVLVAVMRAFYASAPEAAPLPLADAITYLWLSQAFFSLLPWRADAEVRAMINSGGIAHELLRPVDLHAGWLARAVALKTAPVLLRAAPLFVLAMLFLGLRPPASAEAALLWILAFAGAVALASAFTVLLNISLLWTLSADGVQFLAPVLATMLSGLLVPLPLFPDGLQPVLAALPFRGLMDTPHRVWIGALTGGAAWAAMAHQWLWTAALVWLGRRWLAAGLRRVVIQGG